MQHLIRADYVAQSVERKINILVVTVNILWVSLLFTLILSYFYPERFAPLFSWAAPLLKVSYRIWIPFIFAPFYLPIVRNLIVSFVESIRKSLLKNTAFDTPAQAQVAHKTHINVSGGDSTEWTSHLYLHILHPITGRRFSFEVGEAAYEAYNKGDLVKVRYNPENASVLYLESF